MSYKSYLLASISKKLSVLNLYFSSYHPQVDRNENAENVEFQRERHLGLAKDEGGLQ